MEIRDSKRAQRVTPDLSVDRVLELDAIRTAIGDCRGSRVLDAGCGVGHMTRAVEESASVVAVDFSWEGLVRFQFRGSADLARVQADVAHLPLRGGVFDLALSSQVLEHLPADGRDAFLAHLARVLKPDGRLVLTAYNWDRGRQGAGVPKEGFHSSGIFYHCFEPQELREALSRHFAIDAIWGTQADMPGMFRILRLLGRRRLSWDRRWRQRPAALPYSPVLLATGRRRGDGH
jgi:SAM-dependent methyltransferase